VSSSSRFAKDEALAMLLRRRGADVQWHHAEGTHGWPYWSAHLPDYLRLYSDALRAETG
jgi:S-formylglutathione hydrolase FrmB